MADGLYPGSSFIKHAYTCLINVHVCLMWWGPGEKKSRYLTLAVLAISLSLCYQWWLTTSALYLCTEAKSHLKLNLLSLESCDHGYISVIGPHTKVNWKRIPQKSNLFHIRVNKNLFWDAFGWWCEPEFPLAVTPLDFGYVHTTGLNA